MRREKYALVATVCALAILGSLSLACGKGKKDADKETEEALKALEALGQVAKQIDNTASTKADEAKLTVDEASVKVSRTQYSTSVYCYVQNEGGASNGASIKATFKDASGTIVGTANGYVSDILPGKKKPVQLYSSDKVDASATVKVEIDTISGYGNTGEDDISTGNVSVKKQYGYPKVMGEVTNKGSATHSFTLYAVFLDASGSILGMAICGSVSDLAAGGTKTFDCSSSEKIDSWDSVVVGVAAMLQ